MEAKKPSVRIAGDPGAAFQLRRYAWSAKLPLSILTDFEEFAVYDCRVRPVKTDKPTTARVNYIRYTDFPDKWDEVAGIFAKDAILKGSFDRYIGLKKVKGTAEVDVAFLAEIARVNPFDWQAGFADIFPPSSSGRGDGGEGVLMW